LPGLSPGPAFAALSLPPRGAAGPCSACPLRGDAEVFRAEKSGSALDIVRAGGSALDAGTEVRKTRLLHVIELFTETVPIAGPGTDFSVHTDGLGATRETFRLVSSAFAFPITEPIRSAEFRRDGALPFGVCVFHGRAANSVDSCAFSGSQAGKAGSVARHVTANTFGAIPVEALATEHARRAILEELLAQRIDAGKPRRALRVRLAGFLTFSPETTKNAGERLPGKYTSYQKNRSIVQKNGGMIRPLRYAP
jgi:hypothetical protein